MYTYIVYYYSLIFQNKKGDLQKSSLNTKKRNKYLVPFMAPPAGLEPATSWLTVMRSANWAIEEYLFSFR